MKTKYKGIKNNNLILIGISKVKTMAWQNVGGKVLV
jgi:hypothetical protein